MNFLLEPFHYQYMVNAMLMSALIGVVCAFLSTFLMLRGWSLIADALSHATVPGVALAYMAGLPFSIGAFVSGGFAAAAILFIKQRSILKEDVSIGLIFTSFFALGLFILSISPSSVDLQRILMGNILAIDPFDTLQMAIISIVSLAFLSVYWKDIFLVFFDEQQAWAVGIKPTTIKILFFAVLSATSLAAMQTVGALLVIAVVITPGATAYLLSDKFKHIIVISITIGFSCSFLGTYLSYFLDGATGAIIVCLQSVGFILALLFSTKHGLVACKLKSTKYIKQPSQRRVYV